MKYKTPSYVVIIWTLSIFLSVVCISCQDDDTTVNCVPVFNVNAQYNLSLPVYSDLNYIDGYIVLPPDGTNGNRGVIIVNTGNGYNAYDRNAPHLCPDDDTTLIVEEDIKLVCPKDGAIWILRSGQPLNDETEGRTPRKFHTSLNGNTLSITY